MDKLKAGPRRPAFFISDHRWALTGHLWRQCNIFMGYFKGRRGSETLREQESWRADKLVNNKGQIP
jgi:hypothetical protein